MRNLILLSVLLSGCFNYAGLSTDYGRDGSEPLDQPDGGRVTENDGATSADLAEADSAPSSPADMACSPRYTHDNGLGEFWVDCVPLGTYTDIQAMKACEASFSSCIHPGAGGGCYGKGIFGSTGGSSATFVYSGNFAGKTITLGDCTIPQTSADWR